jgi:hypothetical protein
MEIRATLNRWPALKAMLEWIEPRRDDLLFAAFFPTLAIVGGIIILTLNR